ncbi:YidB family protein [Pantoea sp.]|uniref:YidB family protein n=1 Tax=Pantoea sp. TaxID=69393 RepID=UPI00289FF51B|nr:YidB family protein [Pantoea sp.]
MGLLDELFGSSRGEQGSNLGQLHAIWNWVQEQGGIEVLLHKFQQGGLADVFASWIGTGANQKVSSDEIQSAFGQEELRSLADKLGTDVKCASGTLASLLPELIDRMSPQGRLDEQTMHENGLDLGNMVGRLFKQ